MPDRYWETDHPMSLFVYISAWFLYIPVSFVLQESIKYVEEEMKEMDEKGRVDVPPRTSKDGH
jgi:hypothetical protein